MEKIDSKLMSGSGLSIQNNFLFPNISKSIYGPNKCLRQNKHIDRYTISVDHIHA
jgi:hypothetical protein